MIANCGHGPLGDIPCPPPDECHTVYFVNTGTGSPFGDEEAALEAAWRMLVEDMGVPPQAIHGCYLKPGTKLKYSSRGGPTTAEVCCHIDYWCDPTARPPKGNLPPGVHCCCPSRNRQPGCLPPPTPPGPPAPLPPLGSGAPREEKTPRCCYGADSVILSKDLISGYAGHDAAPYLTGEVYGDCTDDAG